MKYHRKNITRHEALPWLPDADSPSSKAGQQSPAKRTRLRLFPLEKPAEKAALQSLCSGVNNKRSFQRLVRAYLAQIADSVYLQENKFPPDGTKPSSILRNLERRAKSVRGFAERMEKPIRLSGIGFILPLAPIRELHRYADDLEDCVRRQRARSKKPPRKPPRKMPRPETRLIVILAEFVRRTTGSPRWGSLAILLRRATKTEFNKASLSELVKFHRTKARISPIYSAVWFPHSGLY
jgi:hypothetical protein